MRTRLPGETKAISKKLQTLLEKAEAECGAKIQFAALSADQGFDGRISARQGRILIEIKEGLVGKMAEYVIAHELGHAIQWSRGYAIVSGRGDEPGAVVIATNITDLILDPLADSIAIRSGFAMATGFETLVKSSGLVEALNKPKRGKRFGKDWSKIWEKLTDERVSRHLGLKPPRFPMAFWTLLLALQLANIIQRASNLNLTVGLEIQQNLRKFPLLSGVVDDLLGVGLLNGSCAAEESIHKLLRIIDYFNIEPGHMLVNQPLTNEILVDGRWQSRTKAKAVSEQDF